MPCRVLEDGARPCRRAAAHTLHRSRLSILEVPEPKTAKSRLHIDVRVPGGGSPDERWARIRAGSERLVKAGGSGLEESDGQHVTMADPEANEFCVAPAPA